MTVTSNVLDQLDFETPVNSRVTSISAESREQITIVSIIGEIDGSNADFIATVLNGFVVWSGKVIIDLSRLEFIGTQGLRVLIGLEEECRRKDVTMAVVPCGLLRRLLQVVDIGRHLPVSSSVDDAVGAVRRSSSSRGPRTFTAVDPGKLRC